MPAIAHQNKILGNTSGGGSTILVTTSESSLYGQTVTLSDGTTTMSGTFSNTGECEFTGVMMIGTLTATSSTASTSINVPYFGVYSMTLSFFSATITATFSSVATCTCVGNGESYTATTSPHTFTVHGAALYRVTATVDGLTRYADVAINTDGQTESVTLEFGTITLTYDNDFRGLSILCEQGARRITKTAPATGNTMYFYPNVTGNWTISGTVSSDTYYSSPNPVVVSSLSTSVSATLETIPDGSTKTPTDDVSIWLSCAGIRDKAYTTLSEVLADSETFNALLGDSNACAYMARSTTWATDICADQYAMSMIGQYDVCCDALLGNATWASAIAQSAYVDYVLPYSRGLIPVMTSNTTPSGAASSNSPASANEAPYKAFDGNSSTYAYNSSRSSAGDWYYQYEFSSNVTASIVKLTTTTASSSIDTYTAKLQVYDEDNSIWVDVLNDVPIIKDGSSIITIKTFTPVTGKKFRLFGAYQYASGAGTYASSILIDLQLYNLSHADELIHGTNNESAYYLDGASETAIVDPSTLSAGTYTFGSTVAKDPSDLTADYTKTIRITPNTKEIVLRPDCALYWWGYESANCEDVTNANGWSFSTYPFTAGVHNNYNVRCVSTSETNTLGLGSKNTVETKQIHAIYNGIVAGSNGRYISLMLGNKTFNVVTEFEYNTQSGMTKMQTQESASDEVGNVAFYVQNSATSDIYALWYE